MWAFAGARIVEAELWPRSQVTAYISYAFVVALVAWPSFNRDKKVYSSKSFRWFWFCVGMLCSGSPLMLYVGIANGSTLGIAGGIVFGLLLLLATASIVQKLPPQMSAKRNG
jgi:hypothetical protein